MSFCSFVEGHSFRCSCCWCGPGRVWLRSANSDVVLLVRAAAAARLGQLGAYLVLSGALCVDAGLADGAEELVFQLLGLLLQQAHRLVVGRALREAVHNVVAAVNAQLQVVRARAPPWRVPRQLRRTRAATYH